MFAPVRHDIFGNRAVKTGNTRKQCGGCAVQVNPHRVYAVLNRIIEGAS